jgi:hypothetical protein
MIENPNTESIGYQTQADRLLDLHTELYIAEMNGQEIGSILERIKGFKNNLDEGNADLIPYINNILNRYPVDKKDSDS